VQINGEWIKSDSNTIDYRGVKITLNYTTNASGPVGVDGKPTWSSDDDITLTLKRDATEPLNKIKSFIEAYNELVKKLEDMLTDKKSKSESLYKPLTDEEKSLMSDKQVEEWEAIAKKGLFRNDAGIQALTNSLRNSLFETIKEAGLTPSQIGISTGRWDEGLGGQIVLDENKLRAALEEDPGRIADLFMSGANAEKYEDKGWLYRMEDIMNNYVNGSQYTSINSLENSIKRVNEQMEKLQQKMYDEEDKLYKKFASLETAMAKIQSQGEWMMSMLNATNNNKK
jgi:flagellar hook-associated protein 2